MTKAALFSAKHPASCPQCGVELVIRSGQHGPFLGCSHYPQCDYIRSLKPQGDGHVVKVLEGQLCPECQSTLVLRQGRFGIFIGCSNYPECGHIAPTAVADATAFTCPQCRTGKLVQRTSRFGKSFYACDRYPACKYALNNQPVAGECAYCHFPLLMEKNTARGAKRFCADKGCGRPVATNDNEE
ncbi:putative DNA topoisomerase [Candidatus Sodalis pierantonius str. SOPE]|uniref:Putative DNA topoisomerase n=1 Tax=Candidatus Sodalis pierantonii str. SOPE TaxID=2342 RepID=W0HH63_9GAMM|nr:topoisomerase DNA-binding C4 zinc finger domain-containing protein [Candidatus Sodalis pierantonius]AHF73024.1 putative DNA topoisomerase [Candidatus Sodalis pierantonius str. SOPE]